MNNKGLFLMIGLMMCCAATAFADFDARFWSEYAAIEMTGDVKPFGMISLDRGFARGPDAGMLFNDLRIVTGEKKEVPYSIVTLSPEATKEARPLRIVNRSVSEAKETILEGIIDQQGVTYSAVEIETDDREFSRQVTVLGSDNGTTWSIIRKDAVIFDASEAERIRYATIQLPDTRYPHLRVKVVNGSNPPLGIKGLRVVYQRMDPGSQVVMQGRITARETDPKGKQTTVGMQLDNPYPVRMIRISTPDTNFKRRVSVLVKRNSEWITWTEDVIFDISHESLKDSKLFIVFPEITTDEFRLLIRDYDSPPITIASGTAVGYHRALIFKVEAGKTHFLFRGNPQARPPRYDVAELTGRQDLANIPSFRLAAWVKNPDFAGHEGQLPLTERYRYLLYGVVFILILGLVVLQYRVVSKADDSDS